MNRQDAKDAMNRQDAKSAKEIKKMREPSREQDELARRVIGAAIEVHRYLGPGFLESVYEEALSIELGLRKIPFKRQYPVTVQYKNHDVGSARLDFLIGAQLIVELKAVDTFAPIHWAQVISYLKALDLPLGLLINFNVPLLKSGIKRVILSSSLKKVPLGALGDLAVDP